MTKGPARRRYCLVGPAYPYRGGISHYNTCLIRELSGKSDVRAINFSRLYPGFLFPGKTQFDESARPLEAPSLRLVDSLNPLSWIRAGAAAARFRPDAVLVQWWHPFFALSMAALCAVVRMRCRAKIVFICHNVLPHERSLVDATLARVAFAAADAFVVQSNEDRGKLSRIKRRSPVIVHPHPSYDFFASGGFTRESARSAIGEGAGPLVLFFGYVRGYKGLRYLLEAMPALRERVPARLLVVGEFYDSRSPYDELVSRLGLGDAVRFVDRYVGNEEVEAYFAASDLVVLPYVSATQSGIAQIAIAFDRPAVVTDVGGLPEAIAHERTGFVVPPRDPAALAGAMARFFEEGWAGKMAPLFAEEKRRFSWSAMAEAVEGLLDRLERG